MPLRNAETIFHRGVSSTAALLEPPRAILQELRYFFNQQKTTIFTLLNVPEFDDCMFSFFISLNVGDLENDQRRPSTNAHWFEWVSPSSRPTHRG
jgi:hypothetical protein